MRCLYTLNSEKAGLRACIYQFDLDDSELCVKLWIGGRYMQGLEAYGNDLETEIEYCRALMQRRIERMENTD